MTTSQFFLLLAVIFIAPYIQQTLSFALAAVALVIGILTKFLT